jgi:predicted secreted protein
MIEIRLLSDAVLPAVPVGSEVFVELPSFGDAGFRWNPRVEGDGLLLQPVSTRQTAPAPPGSGVSRFKLLIMRPGRHEVAFSLQRPWEAAARTERHLTIVSVGV